MLAIKTKHYFSMTLLVLCLVTLVSSQGQNSFLDPKISEAFWNSPQFQRQFLKHGNSMKSENKKYKYILSLLSFDLLFDQNYI